MEKSWWLRSEVGIGSEGTGCVEDNAAQVLPVCRVFGDLQQRSRQAGAAALEDYIFGGASRVPSLDSQSENPRSGLYWLCLAVTLLKALF